MFLDLVGFIWFVPFTVQKIQFVLPYILVHKLLPRREAQFVLMLRKRPHLWPPVFRPIAEPGELVFGQPPRQIQQPVDGHHLGLLFRRQGGTGFADMRRMTPAGKFFVCLVFTANLAVVSAFLFHSVLPIHPFLDKIPRPCTLPSSQSAAIGKPKGLTRKASAM